MDILQKLYDNEINFSIDVFWDGGFELKLGDKINGFQAGGNVDTWEEAEDWFYRHAKINYPDAELIQPVKLKIKASSTFKPADEAMVHKYQTKGFVVHHNEPFDAQKFEKKMDSGVVDLAIPVVGVEEWVGGLPDFDTVRVLKVAGYNLLMSSLTNKVYFTKG